MRTSVVTSPLLVSHNGTAGPYITVATDQLDSILEALRSHEVPVEVEKDAVPLVGRTGLSIVNLGFDADVARVQGILDQVAAASRSTCAGRNGTGATKQELLIKCDAQEMPELMRRVESKSPNGWIRRSDLENRLRTTRALGAALCFSKTMEPVGREVAVLLYPRGPDELYLSNVIPLQGREGLGAEQYSEILADFQRTFIEPLAEGLTVRVFNYRTPIEPPLEEILSQEAMSRLTSFSATANKEQLRPIDVYHWRGFIARTHLDDTVVSPELLSSWLEDEGWPQEQRDRLVSDYVSGRGLLSVFDEEQTAR